MCPGHIPWNTTLFDQPDLWKVVQAAKRNPDIKVQERVLKAHNKAHVELKNRGQTPFFKAFMSKFEHLERAFLDTKKAIP